MIKFTNLSLKLLALASYYTQILTQFSKFSLFFLSPYSDANLSMINSHKSFFTFKTSSITDDLFINVFLITKVRSMMKYQNALIQ